MASPTEGARMAQERKAGDSGPPSGKMRAAIPAARKDDIEDVAWALQTAEATWSRGDRADALKWIRRAAEAASEAELDDRALELAKAAADVASLLSSASPGLTPPVPDSPRITTTSAPPPPLHPSASRTAAAAPTPSKVGANSTTLPRPGQKSPTPPRVQTAAPVSKRGGRRSSPSFTEETTLTGISGAEVPRPRRLSTTNETKRRGRPSKPSADETGPSPATARNPSSTDDIEAWPVNSFAGPDEDDDGQHTRIGTPAYRQTAQRASARPAAMSPPAPLVMSQAVRVIVWRGPDGVHVAPAGTQVAAIGVEAVLVAMDPGADLAAWLSSK